MVHERGEHHRPAKADGSRRRRALAVAALLSLLVAACQGIEGSPTRTSVAERPTGAASPTSAHSSSSLTPTEPRYQNLSDYTDPLDRLSYKLAYSDCRVLGPDRTAEAYGGGAGRSGLGCARLRRLRLWHPARGSGVSGVPGRIRGGGLRDARRRARSGARRCVRSLRPRAG